jgi:hypothetical protein
MRQRLAAGYIFNRHLPVDAVLVEQVDDLDTPTPR